MLRAVGGTCSAVAIAGCNSQNSVDDNRACEPGESAVVAAITADFETLADLVPIGYVEEYQDRDDYLAQFESIADDIAEHRASTDVVDVTCACSESLDEATLRDAGPSLDEGAPVKEPTALRYTVETDHPERDDREEAERYAVAFQIDGDWYATPTNLDYLDECLGEDHDQTEASVSVTVVYDDTDVEVTVTSIRRADRLTVRCGGEDVEHLDSPRVDDSISVDLQQTNCADESLNIIGEYAGNETLLEMFDDHR